MLLAGIAAAQEWQRKQNLTLENLELEDDIDNPCTHGLFEKRESGLGEILGLRCVKCGKQWEKTGMKCDGKMIFIPMGLREKK